MKSKISSNGYEVVFEGYRTLVLNELGSEYLGAHVRNKGFELAYCYIDKMNKGVLCTYVTLYSEVVDVSRIAQKFGGDGHSRTAGFHFKRGDSPFPDGSTVVKLYESKDTDYIY